MTLKIEVGKEYVTRGGEVVKCVGLIPNPTYYPFHMFDQSIGFFVVTAEGHYFVHQKTDPLDIIAEHHAAEPAPTDDYSDEVSDAAMKKMAALSSGLEFEPADEPESLRDKFAMAALAGALAGRSSLPNELLAKHVLAIATAMMEARKKA